MEQIDERTKQFPSPLGGERDRVRGALPRNRTAQARDFARLLRKRAGQAEKRLWRILRDRRFNGFKFRQQYACGPFFIDFFCAEARLAVELDGGVHGFPEQRAKDQRRESFLTTHGIRVLRFGNHRLRTQPSAVRFEIWRALIEQSGQIDKLAACKSTTTLLGSSSTPHPNPLPSEGRGDEFGADLEGW